MAKVDTAKKYWWAGVVAVPLLVALIGVLPSFMGGSSGDTYITNSRVGGDLYFATNVEIADPAARSRFDQALAFAREGLLADARALFEHIAPTVEAAAVYNNLAVVNSALGDDVAAQRAVQQALQLDPVNQTAQQNFALISRAIREQRSNDTILTATPLQTGVSIASSLTSADDADYFSFTAPAGPRDLLRVQVDNKTASFAPDLRLFDADRAEFARSYQTTPGANTMLEFVAVPGATYYVKVDQVYGEVANYALSVSARKAFDRFEPNDDILTPSGLRVGQAIDAGILDREDSDVYRVAVKPGSVRVVVSNRSTTLAPDVFLYDDDKSQVSRQYNPTAGGDVTVEGQVVRAATWYVRVGSLSAPGQYSLRVDQ